MATKKQVVWTVKLVTDAPIDPALIVEALAGIGTPEVVNYVVKSVK